MFVLRWRRRGALAVDLRSPEVASELYPNARDYWNYGGAIIHRFLLEFRQGVPSDAV